ncbi:MAG: hypothetical protein ACI9PP_000497 [Halobacteriales archaeon]
MVFSVSIPVTGWLSLYDGLARFGVDVAATPTFVFAWFSMALVTGFVAVLLGDVSRTPLTRAFLALEVIAAVVAYGPTQRSLTPNV